MQYQPHSYQEYAAEFIKNNPVSCLLLDMGLGKTVITLTAIKALLFESFEVHKVLVIAPLRVARDTWPNELNKWEHLSGLRFSAAVGTERERRAALRAEADIYIINRENAQWLIGGSGIPWRWDMLIVDELSSFKSHQSKRFKALMKVRPKVKRIVGLTGTPSGNGLMDLWAEFRLLDMGQRLGRFIGRYRADYFVPDKRNGQVIFSYKPVPGAERSIHRKISDITISMKSIDYLKMPELIRTDYEVCLSAKEKAQYDKMKQNLVLKLSGREVTAANAAALSGKLCQMANGAVYGDAGEACHIHDCKLDALEDLIEASCGKPLLVAYWFRHDLERISARLKARGIKFSKLDTPESISLWNCGELPVALIHPASAGHGLNLQTGGNTIVWFGLTWSLELYQQTNARLWRQGQQSKTVVVCHLIAKETIDERILKILSDKDTTQAGLIEAVKISLIQQEKEVA